MNGQEAKDAGISRIEENPEAAPWRAVALIELRELARTGWVFTSEDLVQRVGRPAVANAVGAVMNTAARQGWIERTGFTKADHAEAHARIVGEWRGVPEMIPAAMCSCGRGPVGHSLSHESTERPGVVRVVREGKTDQYLDLFRVERESVAAEENRRAQEIRDAERKRLEETPRVDPASHRLAFGGPVPCRWCKGTGGSLATACAVCGGTGLT